MKPITFLLILLLSISSCAKAAPVANVPSQDNATTATMPLSNYGTQALDYLLKSDTFSDPFVGFTGGPSREVVCFVTLLKDPGAPRAFHDLYDHAEHPAGKLYALCGFWFTDQVAFKNGVSALKASSETTQTMKGCVISVSSVGDVVHRSDYLWVAALDGPNDSIKAWRDRQKPIPENYAIDIEGGGIPTMMGDLRDDSRFDLANGGS